MPQIEKSSDVSSKGILLNFNRLKDFANKANQAVGNFRLQFVLSPDQLRRDDYGLASLRWESIHFGNHEEIERIPSDRRGIYALSICEPNQILPVHGYIIYIGIAGRRSDRSLRERYKDYLNEKKVLKERPRLAYAIGTWHEVLKFFFAPVDDSFSSEELEQLEKKLNAALLPPYSIGDVEAEISRKRKAF